MIVEKQNVDWTLTRLALLALLYGVDLEKLASAKLMDAFVM